ncbi:hypothetical protein ACGFIU_15595 [Rhodococcus oryzae]|uniref:hypothetical protein n=1 Tax=Rhodococcus oryzae TaxID=2571143 RepID=UPI003711ABD1
MRRAAIHRSVVARAAASVAVFAVPLCTSAAVTANPPPAPAAATTVFQVPVRFVEGCLSNVLVCWYLPSLTTLAPTATPGASGAVTFATEPSPWAQTCPDVSVTWRNLNTGAAGTTALRRVEPAYAPPMAPEDRCRHAAATALTGSGTIAATADVGAFARGNPAGVGYRLVVNPGIGTFQAH